MSGSEQENQIESLLSLFLMNDFQCTFALRNRFTLVTEGICIIIKQRKWADVRRHYLTTHWK